MQYWLQLWFWAWLGSTALLALLFSYFATLKPTKPESATSEFRLIEFAFCALPRALMLHATH